MQMTTKGNVVLYLDKDLVEKSKEMGFNLSKTFENHLNHIVNGYSTISIQNNANSSEFKSYLVGPPVPIPKRVQNLIKLRGNNLSPQTGSAQRRVQTTLLIDCYEL
jgi:hypothetical protein